MHTVQIMLHVINTGGMHPVLQASNKAQLEQLRETGNLDEDTYRENMEILESATRPIEEQFRFSTTVRLPFIPRMDVAIPIGKYVMKPSFIQWEPDANMFVVHTVYKVCADSACDACSRDIQWLMDETNGWAMLPPLPPEDPSDEPFSGGHVHEEQVYQKPRD